MLKKSKAKSLNVFSLLAIFLTTSLAQETVIGDIEKVVIIGGGPASYSAAICSANGKLAPVVIEGTLPGGQPIQAGEIKNFPSYQSVNGGELVANMRTHAKALGAKLIDKQVTKVDFSQKPFKIWVDQQSPILAHSVIIATGSEPVKLNCPGEDQYWGEGKGVMVCAKCDGHLVQAAPVVIVGGGYSALREIANLKNHTDQITIVNPEAKLSGPQFLINRAKAAGITILNNHQVKQILGDGEKVTGVEIIDQNSGKSSVLPAQGVLVGLGWKPSTQLFKDQLKLDEQNQIIVTNDAETSIPGVFAAGDVTSKSRHQLFMAASSGFAAGMDSEKYLREQNLI